MGCHLLAILALGRAMPEDKTISGVYEVAGVFHMPDAGWFLRLVGSYPVNVGINKPPTAFHKGARVRLSVELASETAAISHAARLSVPHDGRSAGD